MVFLPGAGQLPPLVPRQYQQGVFVASCNRSADRRESAAATLSRLGHRRRPTLAKFAVIRRASSRVRRFGRRAVRRSNTSGLDDRGWSQALNCARSCSSLIAVPGSLMQDRCRASLQPLESIDDCARGGRVTRPGQTQTAAWLFPCALRGAALRVDRQARRLPVNRSAGPPESNHRLPQARYSLLAR